MAHRFAHEKPPPASAPALSRRRFTSLVATYAATAAATLAAPELWAQPKLEKTKITIAVDGKAALDYLPLTLAEQLDFFKLEGLDVDISDQAGGGGRAQQAVLGGMAEVVCAAYEQTLQLQSKNQFFQAVVLLARAPQVAVGVSVKTMGGYKSLADLRGKKIGVAAPGSSAHRVVSLLLARAGIKADEVSIIGMGSPASAVAALRAGQIDVMSHSDPVMTLLEQKGDVRIIADTRTLKGTQEVFGGSMPTACLYAPAEFVLKNPNTTQALVNAVVHSLKWLQTAGPGDIIKTVPEAYLMGDRGLYLASFNKVREAISPDGLIPEDGAKTALRALASAEPTVDAGKIVLGRTYTNEFARKAKARFNA